jgi:cyclopropane-fatty-acyl-phospholipid synthase
LVVHAAKHFGVNALGCTVAQQQLAFARQIIEQDGLQHTASVRLCDYRDLDASFDKVASVGMSSTSAECA